jgi:hypothetical protein
VKLKRKVAGIIHVMITANFLGNIKNRNYGQLIKKMLTAFKKSRLHCVLKGTIGMSGSFPSDMDSDHVEILHQVISNL